MQSTSLFLHTIKIIDISISFLSIRHSLRSIDVRHVARIDFQECRLSQYLTTRAVHIVEHFKLICTNDNIDEKWIRNLIVTNDRDIVKCKYEWDSFFHIIIFCILNVSFSPYFLLTYIKHGPEFRIEATNKIQATKTSPIFQTIKSFLLTLFKYSSSKPASSAFE